MKENAPQIDNVIDSIITKKLLKALKRRERLTGKTIKLNNFVKCILSEILEDLDPVWKKRQEKIKVEHKDRPTGKTLLFQCDDGATRKELQKRS